MATIQSSWNEGKQLLYTQISGDVTTEEIAAWEHSLNEALDEIKDKRQFKILIDLHGFKAVNFDAHKRFRTIVPLTLASYGWKVGYVDLFEEEAKALQLGEKRGLKCIAAAHVHQDESKIALYQERFGNDREQFFVEPAAAMQWIESI